MSIQLSNTTTKRGLAQFFEKEIGANYGDVTGNANLFAEFVAEVNNALDEYLLLWATSAGTWQGDDINHTSKYPIISSDIVAGQRDYTFDLDQNSNKIIDVQKVLILPSDTSTIYEPIMGVDELIDFTNDILTNTNQGVPYQYGKLANGIFLDPIPSYSVTSGIKMVVNREGSYFSTTDITKTPGVPVYHEYFYIKPAYCYARRNNLSVAGSLEKLVLDLEGSERLRVTGKIKEFFSSRERDVKKTMQPKITNFI